MMTFYGDDVNCAHMMKRYISGVDIADADREAVRRRFDKPSVYFDPGVFMEGYDAMAAEFDAADRAGRRTLLTNRYFDGFAPVDDAQTVDSQFEDRFSVKAPERMITSEDRTREGGVADMFETARAGVRKFTNGTMWQQGPTRAFDPPPGNYVEVSSLGRQDVVGFSASSSCTAIFARHGQKLFMAHILSSDGDDLNRTLDAIRALGYSPDKTRLFSPFWTEPDGTTMGSWNHRLEQIADAHGIQIDFFPHAGQTTIFAGQSATWSVGTDFKTIYKKTPRGEIAQLRTVIRDKTYRDYE